MRRAIVSLGGLTGVCALVLAFTGPAHAGSPVQLYLPDGQNDSRRTGTAYFSADPGDWKYSPGDAIQACDEKPDTWGIEATLIVNDHVRRVSTRGHASPWCSLWKTGDLPENVRAIFKACMVRGTETGPCQVSEGQT